MKESDKMIEYRNDGCIFHYNKEKKTLAVTGDKNKARPTIQKLRKEMWIPKLPKAIWFRGHVTELFVGTSLVIYLATGETKPKKTARSFKEIANDL